MFDRYNVEIRIFKDSKSITICNTYFKHIDQVVKFIDRFDENECIIDIFDEVFPEREISTRNLLNIWRSKDDN